MKLSVKLEHEQMKEASLDLSKGKTIHHVATGTSVTERMEDLIELKMAACQRQESPTADIYR